MAINITLSRSGHIVRIPGYSSLEELLLGSSLEYLQKPATSLLMFRRIIAYAELIALEKFPKEEVLKSLQESLKIYNSITEHDVLEPNHIEETVEERLKEDDFKQLYLPLLDEISYEILKIFASGAVSYAEEDVTVDDFEQTDFKGAINA